MNEETHKRQIELLVRVLSGFCFLGNFGLFLYLSQFAFLALDVGVGEWYMMAAINLLFMLVLLVSSTAWLSTLIVPGLAPSVIIKLIYLNSVWVGVYFTINFVQQFGILGHNFYSIVFTFVISALNVFFSWYCLLLAVVINKSDT